MNAREQSDESGDTPTQKADEDLGSSEDTGFVAESKRRNNCVDSNSAMGGISFMQNGVRSDMPIFGGDAQRWHNPFELYVTFPKLTVEAGTGLIDTGAQISLVRRKSLKRLPKENIVETSVTMQGITGSCRSLTQGIYLEINESKPFLFYIVDELPRNVDVILGHKWLIENGYVMTRNPALPPLSEGIVKITTREKGVRLIEK